MTPMNEIDKKPVLIAFGSGKGGVGKSMIAGSMAMALATLKKKVVAVDLDFGAANLHAIFGVDRPERTYYHFYHNQYKSLSEIQIIHPDMPNLHLICGAAGSLGMANLPFSKKMKLLRHLRMLDADYVLLDLGAGMNYNIIDFFLTADHSIVVISPNHLSIIDSYNFLKQAFFRKLMMKFRLDGQVVDMIKQAAVAETYQTQTSVDVLIEQIHKKSPKLADEFKEELASFHPRLLINNYSGSNDEANCLAVKVAAKELLSIEMEYLGAIHQDDEVNIALEEHIPFVQHNPKSRASRDLIDILVRKILNEKAVTSMRDKQYLMKEITPLDNHQEKAGKTVICSVECYYWEVCEFRNGGFPCELGGL